MSISSSAATPRRSAVRRGAVLTIAALVLASSLIVTQPTAPAAAAPACGVLVNSGGFGEASVPMSSGWSALRTPPYQAGGFELYSYAAQNQNLNSDETGGLFDQVNGTSANPDTGLKSIPVEPNTDTQAVAYNFAQLDPGEYSYSFDLSDRFNEADTLTSEQYQVVVYNPMAMTDTTVLEQGRIADLPSNFDGQNHVGDFATFSGNFTIATTGPYVLAFRIIQTAGLNHSYNIDRVAVDCAADPSIGLVKSADAESYEVDDVVGYSFVVTNTGNVSLSGVVVNEESFTGSGELSAVSCPQSGLVPDESMTCSASYTVTQADVDRGSVQNSATVSGQPPGNGESVVSQASSVTVSIRKNRTQLPLTGLNGVGATLIVALLLTSVGVLTVHQSRACSLLFKRTRSR